MLRVANLFANVASAIPFSESLEMIRKTQVDMPERSGDVALVATAPDIPVVPLLVILVPLMIGVPALFYPVSKTGWVAVDRALLQRLDPSERADEQAHGTNSSG